MYLFKKRGKCISIRHPLGKNLPARLTDEEVAALAAKLRAGDSSATVAIVRNFTALAIHIAGQYAVAVPRKADDFVSEAMVAIVEACEDVQNGKLEDDNVGGRIVARIHAAIGDFIKSDHQIRTPYTTHRRHRKSSESPKITVEELTGKILKHSGRTYGPTMLEIREMLELSLKTDVEREILRMRSEYMVDREIGEALGLSTSRVSELRAGIEARYEELER